MNLIIKFLLGTVVSFYLFPISFTFIPESINTKMILAVLGGISFFLYNPKVININLNPNLIVSAIIAIVFSLICFISVDINNTVDYSYVSYFSSFCVWLSGAYFVGVCIRGYHGIFNFKNLTYYVLGVCFAQCILALLIDNFPSFDAFVNLFVRQGREFFKDVDRLYGIGAALDPAGVRFAIVLIMTSALICTDESIRNNRGVLTIILIAFFVVALIGNIISRTTIVGVVLAILYFVLFSGLFRLKILFSSINLGIIFAFILVLVFAISSYLYSVSEEFYSQIRFAFEGFFNWMETGEWRTSSTDKLNNEMWIWPEDLKTWIIGSGIFGSFVYSTDIGYCRFILYSGLAGFVTFAFLFVYNAFAFMNKVPRYWAMFILLGLLSFIIWVKVATDIFFIYALFYSVDEFVNKEDSLQ